MNRPNLSILSENAEKALDAVFDTMPGLAAATSPRAKKQAAAEYARATHDLYMVLRIEQSMSGKLLPDRWATRSSG